MVGLVLASQILILIKHKIFLGSEVDLDELDRIFNKEFKSNITIAVCFMMIFLFLIFFNKINYSPTYGKYICKLLFLPGKKMVLHILFVLGIGIYWVPSEYTHTSLHIIHVKITKISYDLQV